MLLAVQEVLQHGLLFLQVSVTWQETLGHAKTHEIFEGMYGAPAEVLCHMWEDLMATDMPDSEKNLKGFKRFLMAHCFLWGYPRNAIWLRMLFFPEGEKTCQGEPLWCWIRRIADLLPSKIDFLDHWEEDEDSEVFIIGVDGTDCKTWERPHANFPVDPKRMSHKFNHAALKYEIGVAIFHDKIVWVNGPFRGGKHDLTIFREDGLKERMPQGKAMVGDRGYRTSKPDEVGVVATPIIPDPTNEGEKDFAKFMSRVRCRTETVMDRLKEYRCLSDMFRHGDAKHAVAFRATAVTVQYKIDHGAYLYQV